MLALVLLTLLAAPLSDDVWVQGWVGGKAVTAAAAQAFEDAVEGRPQAGGFTEAETCRRLHALSAAGDLHAADALRKRLEQTLADESEQPGARARAARALGWLQRSDALPALVKAAAAGPTLVRVAALDALRFFGDEGSHEVFSSTGLENTLVRFSAAPDARARAALTGALQGADPTVRHAALGALKFHTGEGVTAALLEAVRDGVNLPEVLGALADHAPGQHAELLVGFTKSPDSAVRAAAARGLGRGANKDHEALLLRLLEDPDDEVFVAAHGALRRLEGLRGDTPPSSAQDRTLLLGLWRARLGAR